MTKITVIFHRIEQYIRNLQRSSNEHKRRWLIGASAISMGIVIVLWLFYLSATLPGLPRAAPAQEQSTARVEKSSFFQTLGRGFGVLAEKTGRQWLTLTNNISVWGRASAEQIRRAADTVRNGIMKKNEFSFDVQNAEPAGAVAPSSSPSLQ